MIKQRGSYGCRFSDAQTVLPVGLVSLFLSVSSTYYSVLSCPPLSLSLSLGQQMETMAQFCLLFWSPEGPVAFWTAHGSALHISYKMQVPFLFMKDKKEAAECQYSDIKMKTHSTSNPTELSLSVENEKYFFFPFFVRNLEFATCSRNHKTTHTHTHKHHNEEEHTFTHNACACQCFSGSADIFHITLTSIIHVLRNETCPASHLLKPNCQHSGNST